MKTTFNQMLRAAIACASVFCIIFGAGFVSRAQSNRNILKSSEKAATMSRHANGAFDVKLSVQKDDAIGDPTIGRMSIDKQLHGDLEATSKGQMLSTITEVKGSAGYVAIERVTGTLNGRTGSFSLQHNATMNRGVPELNVIVIPDSGTGQLAGITGKMNIIITDGKHSYEFEYTLPDDSK
jgi:hypothetical protein